MLPTLVDPTAFISENVEIDEGSVICTRATISSGVSIGKGCIVTRVSTVLRKTYIPNWGYYDFDKIIYYHEDYVLNVKKERKSRWKLLFQLR